MQGTHQEVIPLTMGVVKAFLLPTADGRVVLVDTGMSGRPDPLLRQIAQNGYKPADLALIIVTHGHSDHIGQAAALRTMTTAPLLAHRMEAQQALTDHVSPSRGAGPMGKILVPLGRLFGQADSTSLAPDVLIDDEWALNAHGVAGRVLHTPGHTRGSLSVWLDSGDILVGDLVMGRMFVSRRPGYPLIVENAQQLRQSITRIMDLHPRRIYAAHGGPFTPEAMRRAFAWLQT